MKLRGVLFFVIGIISAVSFGQNTPSEMLTFEEYLGYVKMHHPYVKQANLLVEESALKLMKARGAFDPKLEVDYEKKEFKSTTYYDKLNTAFKIPTWFGIELKGQFEENSGTYLNPELKVPEDGLYSMGVSIPLARNLLTNKRMASLKQAKIYENQALAERQLAVNSIIGMASKAYFKWLKAYKEKEVYDTFLINAEYRLKGIVKNFELGEIPAIDTLEAGIIVKNRKLDFERARISYLKASLEVSNYLWLENNTPIELQAEMLPDVFTSNKVDDVLLTSSMDLETMDIQMHPKLRILENKYAIQEIERRLKKNNLLPQIDLQYNFLSDQSSFNAYNSDNYKTAIQVSFPLFLRKERSDLKLSEIKLDALKFDQVSEKVNLLNKVNAVSKEIDSYTTQQALTVSIMESYQTLLKAEERKFEMGESSLFLIISRESKLIASKLKALKIENESLNAKASLFELLNQTNENS